MTPDEARQQFLKDCRIHQSEFITVKRETLLLALQVPDEVMESGQNTNAAGAVKERRPKRTKPVLTPES
ncbi:MAG TPA: hypothetical protein VNQ76_02840 [Planctomicrobium sp.]|nr:hypothetical protein [Planctomicrobium sp.]